VRREESTASDNGAAKTSARRKGRALLRSPLYSLLSASGELRMAFAFEKLLVYQKAVDFADQVASLTEQFPAATASLRADSIVRLVSCGQHR